MARGATFDFNLIRALEVFAAVVETRQVTRAASMLGITQSAASQHLKNLERALGAPLLDRGSRPIEPTRAGVVLYRRATRVLNEVDDLRLEIQRLGSAPLPLLRVGMLASIATTLTPPLVTLARDQFDIPEVSVFAGLANEHPSLLRSKRADVVVTSDPLFELDGLVRQPLLWERFLLVLPKGYDGPTNDLAKLAQSLPLIRFSTETPVGRRIEQHLRRVRLELPRVVEADRTSMVIATVAMGRGFAIASPTLLIDGIAEGMEFEIQRLPVAGFHREITLVARERELGELPTLLAEAFAQVLYDSIHSQMPSLPDDSVRLIRQGDD